MGEETALSKFTDEQIADMKELFITDGLSCSMVARAFNRKHPGLDLTRNAVIGHAARRGWSKPGVVKSDGRSREAKPKPPRVQPRPKPAAIVPPLQSLPPSPVPVPPTYTPTAFARHQATRSGPIMADLEAGQCKAPVGITPDDCADQQFCGGRAVGGDEKSILRNYCAHCGPNLAALPKSTANELARSLRRATR